MRERDGACRILCMVAMCCLARMFYDPACNAIEAIFWVRCSGRIYAAVSWTFRVPMLLQYGLEKTFMQVLVSITSSI